MFYYLQKGLPFHCHHLLCLFLLASEIHKTNSTLLEVDDDQLQLLHCRSFLCMYGKLIHTNRVRSLMFRS